MEIDVGMKDFVQRQAVSKTVVDAAKDSGRLIGYGEAPRGGAGWQGDPNKAGSNFVPYSVVTPMSAGVGSGPLSQTQSDITLPYAITSYGVSPEQCEDQADVVRAAMLRLGGSKTSVPMWSGTPSEYGRRIQTVVIQSYGQVQRAGNTEPPYYGQTDLYALMTSA
jgi:hypothetical protein